MIEIKKKLISMNYSKGVIIKPKYIVIHNTSNASKGANAEAHYKYWSTNSNANSSAHFVVDDHSIIQLLELNQRAWHVGDNKGYSDITNSTSIGIEICENSDGDYNKAEENAKDLVAHLLKTLGMSIDCVKMHKDASGKYCPHIILDRGTWGNFIQGVKDRLNPPKTEQTKQQWYRIRLAWNKPETQIGAYKVLEYAKACADKNKGYYVFDEQGNVVYPIVKTEAPKVETPKPQPKPQVDELSLKIAKAKEFVGNRCAELQTKLNKLGYNCGVVDNVFGVKTYNALLQFQKDKGLLVDGLAGNQTFAKLDTEIKKLEKPRLTRVLKITSPMMKGEDVKYLQKRLNEMGYSVGNIDGYYGNMTANAVRKFQKDKGLLVDGQVFTMTWSIL